MTERRGIRLLSLDGGGVRGLSSLQILKQLMETVDSDSPPKPCDYFDMIGGTSTGGLIAIMLGRLQMTVDECIDAYISLSDRVFQKQRSRISVRSALKGKPRTQGRFNSTELERAIKSILVEKGFSADELLQDSPEAKCKVFVCATSKETGDTVPLTSYRSQRGREQLWRTLRIWEAARATSAATSFFDPITVGQFNISFVDGATGANNPVYKVWNEAQDLWPGLGDRVSCLVSIGTGVPSLAPFPDDLIGIGKSLVAMSTETERTAEEFARDKSDLDAKGRFYRFSVLRGLESIGLESSTRKNEIIAATDRYIGSQAVLKQMKMCAGKLSQDQSFEQHKVPFSLEGMPIARELIERKTELEQLEQHLLPPVQWQRRRIVILHGLGGIGKTSLSVEFARKYNEQFSAVFWLDGRSASSLRQSIVSKAKRIPEGQIPEISRSNSPDPKEYDTIMAHVLDWLSIPANNKWLLIFDNVDHDVGQVDQDAEAYDIRRFFPNADHGAILVTTRLRSLDQLGQDMQLKRVNCGQARSILASRLGRQLDGM